MTTHYLLSYALILLASTFSLHFQAHAAPAGPLIKHLSSLIKWTRTYLKSKYLGTLPFSTGFDGDGALFPLAFGVVDEENDDNWTWFLTELHNLLDAATVFTCLALFNTLISPLNSFPWVINGLIDAIISSRRLSRFLSCSEHRRKVGENISCSSSSLSVQPDSLHDLAVSIQDACCSWSSSDEKALNMVLNHVTLSLSKGFLCCSYWRAYVPQVPWILSGTVRDNILFGKSYHPERYTDTVKACALDVDISLMAGGGMAYIGEKEVNLSGGQRARLALARVLYHDSDVIMLDDVLSAVDVQVARWILHNAILGPLMKGKS
ncbi:hypothetical protein KIW84_072814 [Lathyrus oleraceus]|uniref:ABC transporter domain-containing protein n=1 Tax=Pisum sativum TaxID=3888 RepID=A0A9D4ZWH8_PEA|nr:hypothetical protein KIW84_072814 [Pisum sativum]